MSAIIKELILVMDETVYIGKKFCENEVVFAHWSNLKEYEIFRLLSKKIKRNKTYKICLPDDAEIIDMIVESNFRYFSYISLFFAHSGIIVQPTCHSEIIIYCTNAQKIENLLKPIVEPYSKGKHPIKIKLVNNT